MLLTISLPSKVNNIFLPWVCIFSEFPYRWPPTTVLDIAVTAMWCHRFKFARQMFVRESNCLSFPKIFPPPAVQFRWNEYWLAFVFFRSSSFQMHHLISHEIQFHKLLSQSSMLFSLNSKPLLCN